MKRVITYGTYDHLHQGHINLLRRAKALGDYLIVGVTSDAFDKERGKLNVHEDVLKRIEAVKATGLADEIIIESYVGQKINDIQTYNVDVFAIGSDWVGKFDYLNEFCDVVYLPRTEGISSTQIRNDLQKTMKLGLVGLGRIATRFIQEIKAVSGIEIYSVYDIDLTSDKQNLLEQENLKQANSFGELLNEVEAVYIATPHLSHYTYIKEGLLAGKHVLCETPLVLSGEEAKELYALAQERELILMEANKTAFCPAFNHLIVLVKSGVIGDVVDIDASLSKLLEDKTLREFIHEEAGGSMLEMGSYPLLPIIKLLGVNYQNLKFYSRMDNGVDIYTKGIIQYSNTICSFKLGLGVKTEGSLIISGTKGYIYVPAPWWKTEYFELRYEDQNKNRKFFYKWDEAGLRYEIQAFLSAITRGQRSFQLNAEESIAMAEIMQIFRTKQTIVEI